MKITESQLRNIISESIKDAIKDPRQLLQIIQQNLNSNNGKALYQACQQLLCWVRENYNVEKDDWNGGSADGSRKGMKSTTLAESMKGVDPNNVVPEDKAEQFGFKPEYSGFENGLELWGGRIKPGTEQKILSYLGIKRFTNWYANGKVRITVQPFIMSSKSHIRKVNVKNNKKTLQENKIMDFFRNIFAKSSSGDEQIMTIAYKIFLEMQGRTYYGDEVYDHLNDLLNDYMIADPKKRKRISDAVCMALKYTNQLN